MVTYPSSPIRLDFEAHLPYGIHSPPSSKVNAAATSSIEQQEMEMEMEIDMDQVSDLNQNQIDIDIEDKQEFSFDKRWQQFLLDANTTKVIMILVAFHLCITPRKQNVGVNILFCFMRFFFL